MGDEDQPQTGSGGVAAAVAGEPAAAGTFLTELFPTSSSPSPDDTGTFIPRDTPGNVGVCLSGGGSRAFSAGIGQLQALEALKVNGSSLLSQTRALATVSGGGWIGIPFVFLPSDVSDSELLGTYVEPADLAVEGLRELPPSGIANHVTSRFSIPHLAVQALLLHAEGVSSHDLWQVLMGETFLKPYKLYAPGEHRQPTQFFSYDDASRDEIWKNNPGLKDEHVDLVSRVADQRRPYLISLSALSVTVESGEPMLAPVHSTPFVAGVLSTPPGAVDANRRKVGGGGIWPFAFGSAPTSSTGRLTEVEQSRQWSLLDALGTSSAAFAQTLIERMDTWRESPTRFAAALRLYGPEAVDKLKRDPVDAARMRAKLETAIAVSPAGPAAGSELHQSLQELTLLRSIVPQYKYWSPADPPTGREVEPSNFTDGGSLENTGVAAMLSYTDIHSVIAFLNTGTKLRRDKHGHIEVDECLPPLFGYQPYVKDEGYHPYEGAESPERPIFRHNQVFESSQFKPLLESLWKAHEDGAATIVSMKLTTRENRWFNVAGGTTVTVAWVYLNYVESWHGELPHGLVRGVVDFEHEIYHFPNYQTSKTQLTATQVNLLSNLSSWMVRGRRNAEVFTALYADREGSH